MTAITSPSFWLPPSMQPRPKRRWLDRALDFKRWKRRLLHPLAPIGVADDGDTMLDPNGEIVLNSAGEMELQNATGCTACCPGCASCWTNDTVSSVNITIAGFNYPSDWICYSQDCSADPLYGTPCDPCSVARFNYGSGSIDTTFNVPTSSILVCPDALGGPGPGGHWRTCIPSPVTYLFCGAFDTTQLVTPQFLLIDLKCCCVSGGGCDVTLQIFLIGCACDNTGVSMFVLFDGGGGGSAGFFNPLPSSFTLDNEITAIGLGPLCQDNNTGGYGGTATITKGP